MSKSHHGLSFVVPAYNEEKGIGKTIEKLMGVLSSLDIDWEIVVVNDGSRDSTAEIVSQIDGARLVSHPINIGYGNALKTGILHAKYDWIGIVDADESYPVHEIPTLLSEMNNGFDMVIAARANIDKHDSFFKGIARSLYRRGVNILSGRNIQDPNSGLRIFRKVVALEFFPFLCGRFSFTTSITILSVMKPLFVKFVPVEYQVRAGKSHVNHFKDSLVTLRVMIQGVTFYNPIKFFFLLMLLLVFLVGAPSMLLALLGMATLSAYFLVFSCTMVLLFGIGVLADIVRVSITRGHILEVEKRMRKKYELSSQSTSED